MGKEKRARGGGMASGIYLFRIALMQHKTLLQKREILPETAFLSFKKSLEEPDATEGFDEIRRVNFKFDGSEEERAIWSRWMT